MHSSDTPGVIRPLFERYPKLRGALPFTPLASLPTPVERSEGLERVLGHRDVYIKRDDISGSAFGGNKVRKLEFLIGEAKAAGAKTIITVGAAGSNHALATSLYCRDNGLTCAIMLYPQPSAHSVRHNLLGDLWAGARIHPFSEYAGHRANLESLIAHYRALDGAAPYSVPAGGSSPTGVIGYVNAGLELAEQIERGELPRPRRVYVAMGTMGTAVGLWIGLRCAGVDTTVVGVRVVPQALASQERAADLAVQASGLLHRSDASFPLLDSIDGGLHIEHNFYGSEYGRFTAESVAAMAIAGQSAGLELDGTYTGKAFAAVLSHTGGGLIDGPVVFVNTRNSRALPPEARSGDYHDLPRELWHYFEQDVQELDRRR